MGTSLSNLQILGAEESSVRAALPKAVVGRWSERFVTACPGELSFGPLNRTANQLSKTLSCTVLAVSIFDGDALDLTLYGQGKRLTHHIVNQEGDVLTAGNCAQAQASVYRFRSGGKAVHFRPAPGRAPLCPLGYA